MQNRTTGAVTLGPSLNMQGGYKLLNLISGQIINRREFTELPMPDSVIKRMEELTTADGEDGNIIFTNRACTKIANIKETDEYEDWSANANLTGVDLQTAQDHQNMVNSYANEDDNKDVLSEYKSENKNEIELGHPPTQNELKTESEPTTDKPIEPCNINNEELAPSPAAQLYGEVEDNTE
eukprot:12504072-Ditylum_brightwellii.AAC.1